MRTKAALTLLLLVAASGAAAATPGAVDGGSAAGPNGTPSASVSAAAPPSNGTAAGVRTVYNTTVLNRTGGGAGVDVAVLDTGVDADHPDLERRVELCRDYTADPVRNGSCSDGNGHGTHVAGVVLADGGPNGTGTYGVAPEADLYAFKVCSERGSCRSDGVTAAIRDAADEGAEIIVLSLGGKSNPHLQEALDYADGKGALLIAAAGNDGPGLDTVQYPAADELVVAVGAVELVRADLGVVPAAYRVADFSSRGTNATGFAPRDGYVEVAAPGVGVVSTGPDGGYVTRSGTSMAAPHVAGLAAKLWPLSNDTGGDGRADDVRRLLRERAVGFDITAGKHARPGYDPAAGAGLPTVKSPRARFDHVPPVAVAGEPTAFNATRSTAPDSSIVAYGWDFDDDGAIDARGRNVTRAFASPGAHRVTLRVTTRDGLTDTATRVVRINAPPVAVLAYSPSVPRQNRPVGFDASESLDPDGSIPAYEWDFDSDGLVDARRANVSYAFPTYGVHEVTLRVTDEDGATATATRSILVNDRPAVSVDARTEVVAGRPATLAATVADEIGHVTVTWRVENGTPVDGRTITRTFEVGRHRVTVRAEDEYGAAATETVVVIAREPEATQPAVTETPAQPGFTAGIALAALVVLAALAALRRRRE